MKRQVGIMISIALVSFLIGTMFNMNLVAIGGDSNPWDKVWTAISDLQDRVNAVEEKTNQVKTIRFYDPSEYSTSEQDYETVFTFEWTPTDSTNNVVLMMAVYAEVNCTVEPSHEAALHWQVNFTGNLPWRDVYTTGSGFTSYEDFEYTWTETIFSQESHGIPPNQPNYTFDFQILCRNGIAYFRNINIIITVADGLPASN